MGLKEHKAGENVLVEDGKFAVMFYIPGHCAGCKMAKSILENKELKDFTVLLVDAENELNKQVVQSFMVTTAPTFIVYENSKELARIEGLKEFLAHNKELFGD